MLQNNKYMRSLRPIKLIHSLEIYHCIKSSANSLLLQLTKIFLNIFYFYLLACSEYIKCISIINHNSIKWKLEALQKSKSNPLATAEEQMSCLDFYRWQHFIYCYCHLITMRANSGIQFYAIYHSNSHKTSGLINALLWWLVSMRFRGRVPCQTGRGIF